MSISIDERNKSLDYTEAFIRDWERSSTAKKIACLATCYAFTAVSGAATLASSSIIGRLRPTKQVTNLKCVLFLESVPLMLTLGLTISSFVPLSFATAGAIVDIAEFKGAVYTAFSGLNFMRRLKEIITGVVDPTDRKDTDSPSPEKGARKQGKESSDSETDFYSCDSPSTSSEEID